MSAARDLLLAFSEWLDAQGLHIVPEGDERTHEDLANWYLALRSLSPGGEPLTKVWLIYETDGTSISAHPKLIGVTLTQEEAERQVEVPEGSWFSRSASPVTVLGTSA